MKKLCFYVPVTHLDEVKLAVFNAGAGRYGKYEHCAWQILGQGQFKPLAGSQPFLGQPDQLEVVPEYKVETICEDSYLGEVIRALKAAHPYEEPAFDIHEIEVWHP